MEEMWSSIRPAKPSYGDVFGGAPNYAKSNDYSEIFGGFASSCSIPFLELPPPNESDDGCGLTDYSEIFGACKAADFAVDYEELFSKKTVERVQMEAKYSQPVGASDISPEGATDLDYGACSEKNKFSSNCSHSDDGSKQFKMSYHGASRGCIEDVITGKTHTTQLYAEPGSTYPINSYSSLQNRRSNNSSDIQANDLIHSTSCNGQLNDAGQDKIASVPSSGDNIKSYGADLKSNEKEFSTNPAASEDGPVHKKHHSRSSSNYAASSGDVPYPDVTYVSISDINLRTKPSRMPPPSRAPPKLINKQEVIKVKMNSRGGQGESSLKPAWTQQVHYSIGSAKSHGPQGVAKDNSSGFLDVEVDAHSALAASAAAMKEAMEQAQAKLKNAKELMDRKRENLPGRKKMGNKESAKFDERKRVTAFEEEKMFGEVTANKPLQKEDKERKEHTFDDMQKTIKLGTAASYDELQGNRFNSSQICNKSEEANGEWRIEKQFYELINNVKKFGIVKEAYKHDDFENKLNTTSKVGENVINYSVTAELDREVNGAVKVCEISEPVERDEINDNSKAYNVIHNEEMIKKADKIPETCMSKESKSEESHGCHYQNGNKKLQTAQEALFSAEERKKSNGGKEATCVENEMNVESSNNYSKIGDVFHGNEENRNFPAVKETLEHDVKEKQSCEHYVTSMLYESEKKLEGFRGTGVQHENENDINVTTAAHVIEAEEIALEEAYPYENSDYTWGNGKVDSYDEENECQWKDAAPINAHEESMMNRADGVCMTVENDFNNQDGNEAKENFQELKPAPDITELKGSEEKINSAKERCWSDYNSMERRDSHQEYQQNEKKQDVEQTTSVVKNTGEPGVSRDDHSWGKNGKFREGTEATKNMDIKFDATEVIFQRSENKDIEDVENGSKCENEDLGDSSQEVCQNPSSSHTAKETLGTADTENCNHDVRKRYKPECEKTIVGESDHGKEQARELEEEKAGEREREKERLMKYMESATREAQAIEEEKVREREKEKERLVKYMERATREAQSIEEEKVRERESEKERLVEYMERATCEAQAIEEEKLREREREKEQLMKYMERATREAHERAARERAERIAVERATAEARKRALTEAREKVEKAAAEALEKSLTEKALKEAKLRAERAAVERATAEARERAVEKALAEKAAADARQRAERLNTISRDKVRKESEGGEYSAACDKDNRDVKLKAASSDVLNNQRFRSTGPSGSSQRYADSSAHGEAESPLRCKARFERHQRTVERAAKALAEKNTRDILAQQEQAERNRLAESLDADVKRWSTGKEGNLRALLSTLQYILGPESGWQPIPLTDVITAVAVKKAYRKATLYVHPDKLQQRRASIQQKYICEKVFDLLKEAWNRFNSEER